jgi:amidohydrolase
MENIHYLESVFEQLHQHPEVSLQEKWTAQFVATELRKFGFTVTTGVGGTGVVGVLECEHQGPVLALRSDMDALPVQEKTGVDYASCNPGVMHACGHDSHMAIALGACAYAAQNRESLAGILLAIFQPAEETVVGALAMLADGVFSEYQPERLVGIHNWPKLPAGSLGLQKGPITAFADRFRVIFRGQGGHGAFPHTTKDPIAMATNAVQAAFSLTRRKTDSLYPQVLSFGVIQGGTSFNVIPETVMVEGTVRTLRRDDQELMISLLHQAFGSAAALYGGSYELEYDKGVPSVINNATVVEELQGFFTNQLPDTTVVTEGLASLIGEDVAYFLQEVPGVLLYVGSGQEGAINELHNPSFLVPRQSLKTGYKALVCIINGYLGNLEGRR